MLVTNQAFRWSKSASLKEPAAPAFVSPDEKISRYDFRTGSGEPVDVYKTHMSFNIAAYFSGSND